MVSRPRSGPRGSRCSICRASAGTALAAAASQGRCLRWLPTPPPHLPTQGCFSVLVFILLSSQDGFQTEWKEDDKGILRAPAIYNGARPAMLACSPLPARRPAAASVACWVCVQPAGWDLWERRRRVALLVQLKHPPARCPKLATHHRAVALSALSF